MPNSYKNVWTLSPCRGPNSGVAFGAGGSKSPVRCPWIGWPGDLPVPSLPSLLSVAPPGRWRISAQPFAIANISARSSLSEIARSLSLTPSVYRQSLICFIQLLFSFEAFSHFLHTSFFPCFSPFYLPLLPYHVFPHLRCLLSLFSIRMYAPHRVGFVSVCSLTLPRG